MPKTLSPPCDLGVFSDGSDEKISTEIYGARPHRPLQSTVMEIANVRQRRQDTQIKEMQLISDTCRNT